MQLQRENGREERSRGQVRADNPEKSNIKRSLTSETPETEVSVSGSSRSSNSSSHRTSPERRHRVVDLKHLDEHLKNVLKAKISNEKATKPCKNKNRSLEAREHERRECREAEKASWQNAIKLQSSPIDEKYRSKGFSSFVSDPHGNHIYRRYSDE